MSHAEPEPTLRGLSPGQRVFARYVLQRRLGRGGMGEVWLAVDEKLSCDVALKFVADHVRWDPASLELLKQETKRSRLLSHSHILRIHDFAEDEAHAAIAMEFLPGGSLHSWRAQQAQAVLTTADILSWLPGVCAAIDHAHSRKIVHRDLKPGNLLRSADGAVKVADFGIAQPLLETALRISQWQPAGTLAYMSPQQQFGEPARPADDIYALGATLYELLTSKPPFYSGNLAAQIERRRPDSLAARRRELGVSAGELSPVWEEVIGACLAKQPEDRPRDATEIAARLAADGQKPRRGVSVVRKRRRIALGMLGAVAVTLVLLTSWRHMPQGGDKSAAKPVGGHASDAARAMAAWNLDGEGRDDSGRGADLRVSRAVATEDRFGRIDRALYFNGNSALSAPGFPAVGWGGDEPFTAALWLKPAVRVKADGAIMTLRSERQDDPYWQLVLDDGRLHFIIGRLQVDAPSQVQVSEALPTGRWSHVAAVSDGRMLRVFVDGRLAGSSPLQTPFGSRIADNRVLMLGYEHKFDALRYVGAMDEARYFARALSSAEIAQLATPEAPPRFAITHGTYHDQEDLAGAVRREYGPTADLADWAELRRWHADDIAGFCDRLGITVNAGSFFVQRDGRRHFEGPRQYFVSRFDGRKPDYYKAHDELGGMVLALGSWYGAPQHALARIPHSAVERIELRRDSGGALAHVMPLTDRPLALRFDWRQEILRGQADRPVLLRLWLRDGRELRAECRAKDDGVMALALGTAERPEFTRQMTPTYDIISFSVVVQPGRLLFRGVSRLGVELLFQESVLMPDLKPADISRLEVSDVDAAELTIEK